MPIYEYRCEACNHEFDTLQKVSEAPLTRCPACEKDALKKKVSAAGFRLKGGGWYETDFKSGGKKNVSGSDGDGKSSGDGDGGTKDAGKSATKDGASASEKSSDKASAGSSASSSAKTTSKKDASD